MLKLMNQIKYLMCLKYNHLLIMMVHKHIILFLNNNIIIFNKIIKIHMIFYQYLLYTYNFYYKILHK